MKEHSKHRFLSCICLLVVAVLLLPMITAAAESLAFSFSHKNGSSIVEDGILPGAQRAGVKITKQPVGVTVAKGKTAKVTLTATGDGLTYKWYFKDKGASAFAYTSTFKGASYSVKMTEARANRQVRCVVTDKYGNKVTSNTVTLKMKPTALKITKQPASVIVAKGKTAKVTLTAAGDGLTYKWYYKDKGSSSFKYTSAFKGASYSVKMTAARAGRQVRCVVTDKYGNKVTSSTATLSMGNKAKITKQPVSVSVAKGKTAKVTLTATGDGLTYKWYYKDKGSSSFKYTSTFKGASYSVKMTAARAGRQVRCVVTDKYGNKVTSDTATLNMATKVKITQQPESVMVAEGETAKVTLSATGDGLTYKWYYKDLGASSFKYTSTFKGASYSVKMTAARAGRQVRCVVSDKYGNKVTSSTATLNMEPQQELPPADVLYIITQPESVTVAEGEYAKATVKAQGKGLVYQWYYAFAGTTRYHKSTTTSATFSVLMDSGWDGVQVCCVIMDQDGNEAATDVVTLNMIPQTKLEIVGQPANVTVKYGKAATAAVAAVGDGLTYEWYYAPPKVYSFTKSDVTASSYAITMNFDNDGYRVYCIVSDRYGNSLTTDTVTLSMVTPPDLKLTKQPQDVSVASGGTATFSIGAQGDGLTYQWYYQNANSVEWEYTPAAGATSATYSFKMSAGTSARSVYCKVSDQYGRSVISSTAGANLSSSPITITSQPQDMYASPDFTGRALLKVSVAAEGDGLTYLWYSAYVDSPTFTPLTDANDRDSSYSFYHHKSLKDQLYYCVITDAYGNTVRTRTARLGIQDVTITKQPQNTKASIGDTVTLTVEASGDGLSYYWYCLRDDDTSYWCISADGPECTFQMTADMVNAGIYCKVEDRHGTYRNSDIAMLSLPAFGITQWLKTPPEVCEGETITLKIAAEGVGLKYQWYYQNPNTSGFKKSAATGTTYVTTPAAAYSGRKVYCAITDKSGRTITSNTVTLIIHGPVSITSQPKDAYAFATRPIAVGLSAEGLNLTYQWYYKNAGESQFKKALDNGPSYSTVMGAYADGRQVYCVVTDQAGNTVKSNVATLHLKPIPAGSTLCELCYGEGKCRRCEGDGSIVVHVVQLNPLTGVYEYVDVTRICTNEECVLGECRKCRGKGYYFD